MYNSYYSSQGILCPKRQLSKKVSKSTSQYLFLNLIRIFSIIFLVLTFFYIPVYIGIGQVNSLYWQQVETEYKYPQRIFLQGTIFAIRKYEKCYQKQLKYQKVKEAKGQVSQNIGINKDEGEDCFQNKLQFLPFIKTVEQFHTFYFCYFLTFYFVLFAGVVFAEFSNKKLYTQLQYFRDSKGCTEKLEMRKIFHLVCKTNCQIYFLKPLIKTNLQKVFNENSESSTFRIKNLKITLNQKFKSYAQLHIQSKQLEEKTLYLRIQLEKQQDHEEKDSNILSSEILQLKSELDKINWQKTHLQNELQKMLKNKSTYHYNNFWMHVESIQDCISIKRLIKRNFSQCLNVLKSQASNFQIFIDEAQCSDLIIDNIENREIISLIQSMSRNPNNQQISSFQANDNYRLLNKILQIMKVIFGVLLCLVLIIVVDIVILIIQKTQIFSYSTVLVVLVLQIILKAIIIKLSQIERHSFYSHQKLSIMLKLTLLVFFNLTIVLIIANHDLGSWKLGKLLSTYQFNSINEQWFLIIGTSILIIVIIQIVFCNLRVYIEIGRHILFAFLQQRLTSLLHFNTVKQRLLIWVEDFKLKYKRPIIDLQICYSQVLPIYMIGLTFGYSFPVLYPLLFIFSITVYHTHHNYIELYTEKFTYSGTLLNDWAFIIIYATFFGGLFFISFVQKQFNTFLIICAGLMVAIIIGKHFLLNLDSMVMDKLETLLKEESPSESNPNKMATQRRLIQETETTQAENHVINETKLSKSEFFTEELKEKQIQLTLLQLFNYESQNINEVHSQYYQRYKKLLNEELQFIYDLQKRIQSHQTKQITVNQ